MDYGKMSLVAPSHDEEALPHNRQSTAYMQSDKESESVAWTVAVTVDGGVTRAKLQRVTAINPFL